MSDDLLKAAFLRVLAAEDAISALRTELDEHTARLKVEISNQEMLLSDAWKAVAAQMAETGEYEVLVPGAVTDFRIRWSTPRESVKVVDPAAVPDALCKLERKPRLKEIGDYLRQHDGPLPNWASLETSEPKLEWKAVKKS